VHEELVVNEDPCRAGVAHERAAVELCGIDRAVDLLGGTQDVVYVQKL
jgi:hypothetical protein